MPDGHQWDITDPTTKPCDRPKGEERMSETFSCRAIRRSTVAERLEGHCVFYCDYMGCDVHTFVAYPP